MRDLLRARRERAAASDLNLLRRIPRTTNWRTLPIIAFAGTLLLTANPCVAQTRQTDFHGAWAFVLPDGNPAWLKLTDNGTKIEGTMLWSVGSARPVNSAQIQDGQLSFQRNLSWKPGGASTVKKVVRPFRGVLKDGDLQLTFNQVTVNNDDAPLEEVVLVGKRIPPPPPRPDLSKVEFGKAIELFNGRDLAGWKLSNPNKKNGWSVRDGCLVNETPKVDFAAYGEFGNLMTERRFTDFELTIDYNVPVGGNSGVYLRGMYEAQVVDRHSRMQGMQGPGAIFGRIKPSKNAGKPGGQWNTYVLTLVDRHVTVSLNNQTVIDNQLLDGCTGGGIQADDTMPGPIFLQGDHTNVKYRNIRLRPITGSSP